MNGMIGTEHDRWINVQDGEDVLEFVYSYLKTHSRPPSDGEVHNVTAAIARYIGPQVIETATLELFLAATVIRT